MTSVLKVIFCGRKPVAARCLRKLHELENVSIRAVLTDDGNPQSDTAHFCKSNAIPIYPFKELEEKLEKNEIIADVGFSVLYWKKFKGSYLEKLPLGLINFHPAPLPEFKGIGGYNLALLNNIKSWAVTAHFVDKEIDTGPIIDLIDFRIDSVDQTVWSLQEKSQEYIYELFSKIVAELSENKRLSTRPNIGGTYTSSKMLEQLKEISTNDTNEIIDLKIKAFFYPPYHGAKIFIGNKWYTLIDDKLLCALDQTTGSSIFLKPEDD
jgi:methionyl-tRNA formyltransferase